MKAAKNKRSNFFNNSAAILPKNLAVLLAVGMILTLAGCIARHTSNVPPDFLFVMDVGSPKDGTNCPININIRIDANGRGRYEYYDTNCAIEYDSDNLVRYERGQVVKAGKLKLSNTELEGLWEAINKNSFFMLTEDYHMAIGFSYAFILIEAGGQRHMVDNIGMEIPEIRSIVEAVDAIMPEDVHLEYGEGYLP